MLTAHSLARRFRGPLGLAADLADRAALHVANAHDLIDPRGLRTAYTMNAAQMAEVILCAGCVRPNCSFVLHN